MSVGIDEDRWQDAVQQQSQYVTQLQQRLTDLGTLNTLLRRQLAAANEYIAELERQADDQVR